MEPFDTRSPAPALADTERKKKKKSKQTESEFDNVPPNAPKRKPRVQPPPSEFAFPQPVPSVALDDAMDMDMPDVDPDDGTTVEPPGPELTEEERDEALVVQALADRDAERQRQVEADKRYAEELAATHAAHMERHRHEAQSGPARKHGAVPPPSNSPVHRRDPVPPFLPAEITSGKLIADVQAAEVHKRSVHEPQHNLPAEQQLADMEFHSFVPFFRVIQHSVMGKTWSPSIEAWVFRQFKADAQPARILRDALQLYEPDRTTRCYFPDLEHMQAFAFNVLFHGRHPVDVIERHAQRLRVRRSESDKGPTVAESCAALAHAMRELVSYYPHNMRPPTELLMAKVKAKLPATVAAQLDDAEFLLNRSLTYEEFYETLNRADQRYGKSLESRGGHPPRRDNAAVRGGNANGKRGRNGGRGGRGRGDDRSAADKKPKVTCRYCKKPGHTLEECYTLKNKKAKEAKGGAKPLTHADLKSAIAEAFAAREAPASK